MRNSNRWLIPISIVEISFAIFVSAFIFLLTAEGVRHASKSRFSPPLPTYPVECDFENAVTFWLFAAAMGATISLIITMPVVVVRRLLPICWRDRLSWTPLKLKLSPQVIVRALCLLTLSFYLVLFLFTGAEVKEAFRRARCRTAIDQKLRKLNGRPCFGREELDIQFWPSNGELSQIISILHEVKASRYLTKIDITFRPLTDEVLDALFALNGDFESIFRPVHPENRPFQTEQPREGHVCWYPFGKGNKR